MQNNDSIKTYKYISQILSGNPNNENQTDDNKTLLCQELDIYRSILKNKAYEFLCYLIDLEYSVFTSRLSDKNKKALNQLKIYSDIIEFNITEKASEILKRHKIFLSSNPEEKIYSARLNGFDIFSLRKTDNQDWQMDLYQQVYNKEAREAELLRISMELSRLYLRKNPYSDYHTIGGKSYGWELMHTKEVEKLENEYKRLNYSKPSDELVETFDIINNLHQSLLIEFELDCNVFDNMDTYNQSNKSHLTKKLVKTIPGVTVIENIKYI